MRCVALVLAGLVAGLASAAIAEPAIPPGAVVTNPDWLQKPSGEDLAEQYPAVAQFVGLAGKVVLHCSIASAGALDCQVVDETPPGLGFGDAAMTLSKSFKMKPMTINGKPVDGGTINIPIQFRPPDEEDEDASPAVEAAVAALAPGAASPGADASARSTELARKIAGVTLGRAGIKPFKDIAREGLIKQFGGPKLTAAQKAALDDYVEAAAATLDARIEATAQGYAQLFSEKELADIDAFYESASGRAWLGRSEAYAAKVSANLEGDVRTEARKRFCAQFKCPAAPAAAQASAQPK